MLVKTIGQQGQSDPKTGQLSLAQEHKATQGAGSAPFLSTAWKRGSLQATRHPQMPRPRGHPCHMAARGLGPTKASSVLCQLRGGEGGQALCSSRAERRLSLSSPPAQCQTLVCWQHLWECLVLEGSLTLRSSGIVKCY